MGRPCGSARGWLPGLRRPPRSTRRQTAAPTAPARACRVRAVSTHKQANGYKSRGPTPATRDQSYDAAANIRACHAKGRTASASPRALPCCRRLLCAARGACCRTLRAAGDVYSFMLQLVSYAAYCGLHGACCCMLCCMLCVADSMLRDVRCMLQTQTQADTQTADRLIGAARCMRSVAHVVQCSSRAVAVVCCTLSRLNCLALK